MMTERYLYDVVLTFYFNKVSEYFLLVAVTFPDTGSEDDCGWRLSRRHGDSKKRHCGVFPTAELVGKHLLKFLFLHQLVTDATLVFTCSVYGHIQTHRCHNVMRTTTPRQLYAAATYVCVSVCVCVVCVGV